MSAPRLHPLAAMIEGLVRVMEAAPPPAASVDPELLQKKGFGPDPTEGQETIETGGDDA